MQAVKELRQQINALPAEYRPALQAAADKIEDHQDKRRRILNLVQEALAQLRLDMKYLMFDLDATRRERDEARRAA